MNIGIIGNATDKFTVESAQRCKDTIRRLIQRTPEPTVVSGHCHLGGVDIWAEEIAKELGVPTLIFAPKDHSWAGPYGYKARNLDIAKNSDEVHVFVAMTYPPEYKEMRFDECYHCRTNDHVKSGACWTMIQAKKLGKRGVQHIV